MSFTQIGMIGRLHPIDLRGPTDELDSRCELAGLHGQHAHIVERFGMVGFHRKLEESVTDPAALVRDLIARS